MKYDFLKKIITITAAVCSLTLFGCDTFDGNTLGVSEENASPATVDAPSGLAKGGAANTTVGANVSVWDSNFDDPDPADGIQAIGGDGQVNGEFTIAERDDIQIALRAQQRFEGTLEVSGKKVGVYEAETGQTGPVSDNLATWNYDWHVDLRGTGTTLADYDLTLHVTNVANEIFGSKSPIDLTFGSSVYDDVVLYQQSWNPGFGNDTFDPNEEGTYNLRLRLSPKAGGPPLSVKIQVIVTDPS